MEEKVGEWWTRVIGVSVSGFVAASVCVTLNVSGEILTGSIYSLATQIVTPGGPFRKIIHPSIYAAVAVSYFVMEAYISCSIKRQSVNLNDMEVNINRSRPVSMSITLSLVVLISSDFVLPKFVKGPDYFSAKVLISTLIFFVFIPSVIIWHNPNIRSHLDQQLLTRIPALKKFSSKVSPEDSRA